MAGSSPNTRHLPKQARGGFPKEPPSTSSKITSAVRSRLGWPRSLEAESRVQQLLSLLVASPASPHLLPILVRSRTVKYIYSSFSFSSPILFLSLPSVCLPHPPDASKGGGVGRAARGGGGPPPPSPPPLPPPRPPSRGCPPETMARPLSRRTEGRQRHVGTAGRPPSLLPARVGATAPSLASPQRGWLGLRGGGSRPPGGRRPPTRRGVGGPRRWPRPLAGLVPLAFALSPSVLTSLCWIPVCRCSRGLVP